MEVARRTRRFAVDRVVIARLCAKAMIGGGRARHRLSVAVVGDRAMRVLNREYHGVDDTTDVLAFPVDQLTPGELPSTVINGQPLSLGDIFICPTVVERQARELGIKLGTELALIITHGLLHLLGYDHRDPADAEKMSKREQELMTLAGFSLA